MNPPETIRVSYVEDEAYFLESFEKMPPAEGVKSYKATSVIMVMTMAGAVVMAFLARHDQKKGDPLWWLPLVIFPCILLLVWFANLSPNAQRRTLRKELKKHVQTPPAKAWLEFGDTGFLSAGHGGRSSYFPWQTIPRAVVRADGMHIFTDGTTAYWLPKRIFASEEDFRLLEALLVREVAQVERVET